MHAGRQIQAVTFFQLYWKFFPIGSMRGSLALECIPLHIERIICGIIFAKVGATAGC